MIKKKIIATLMSVLLLFICFGVITKAAVSPRLIVGQASGNVGDTVTLQVSIENNPGIMSGTLKIEYDKTRLNCTKVVLNSPFASGANQTYKDSYFTFLLSKDNAENGALLTLTFEVHQYARVGDTEVSVSYEKGNITNHAEEDIEPQVVSGKITIIRTSDVIIGDANKDGSINASDLVSLKKSLLNGNAAVNCDMNSDGSVDIRDLQKLKRIIAEITN